MRRLLSLAAVVLAAAPLFAQAQISPPTVLVPGADGYPVPDYVGIANWANSPTPSERGFGNPQIARPTPTDSAANVFVVSPVDLQLGTLSAVRIWNQGGTAVGRTFNAYVLRPAAGGGYDVVFDSGALTVPALPPGSAGELVTFGVLPFRVLAGDRLAHYGSGIPITIGTGTDVLLYPANVKPTAGTSVTPGLAPFPIYPQARTYSIAAVVLTGGMRKFVDGLPGLGVANANNLGQYLPVAVADTTTFPDADYYEIELRQYQEQMHSDLPPTTLRGYVQVPSAAQLAAGTTVASDIHYLGPIIVAQKNRPVRVKFTNKLPTDAGGKLFIPVDETVMGAGTGPLTPAGGACDNTLDGNVCAKYPQNRATLHLHGGHSPWISDGTPHQWITPAGEATPFKKGVSVSNVPDMADPGDGSQTFYWTNQQSGRLMFYHDHSYGITRLNVYVGEAAGYVLRDPVETALVTSGLIPADEIPLIIQDKSFVDAPTILSTDPTWRWGTGTTPRVAPEGYDLTKVAAPPEPVTGDLWYPHAYVPAQNPYDFTGVNPFGRWHYGPWFWPPTTGVLNPPVPNPYFGQPFQPNEMPGVPHPSAPGESFLDVPVVNGTAFPTLTVDPKSYRFRILNAANDRFFNLQLYVAADQASPTAAGTTGAVLCSSPAAVPTGRCTEVKMVPANANPAFPASWPIDGREGGVPDPAAMGPSFVQFANEAGLLPAPTVVPNQPIVWNANPTTFNFGNVSNHGLLVAPAERADVVVDFSAYAGKTLIVYNDAPAAFPALDNRYDYYTGAPDLRDSGGHQGPVAGYGPNTRTVMQIVVRAATGPVTAFDLGALEAAFKSTPGTGTPAAPYDGAFARSQDPVLVAQGDIAGYGQGLSAYDTAYGKTGADKFPFTFPYWGISRIQDNAISFKGIDGSAVNAFPMEPKAIQDEMGEVFDVEYGRMSGRLGLELPNTTAQNQNFVVQNFIDMTTEVIHATQLAGPVTPNDGTQIWKITHNGVDTHPIHFHIFEVQVLNRVGWDGAMRLPDANELGWKDTVRISPLEDTIVAVRMVAPKMPFGIPDSIRPMSPATPLGSPAGLSLVDPYTGQPLVPAPVNQVHNYSWEYVWHCHILSHEEMDMMRPVTVIVPTLPPGAPTLLASTGPGGNLLSWTDPTPPDTSLGNLSNEIGFHVLRAAANSNFAGTFGAPVVVGNALANATSYTDASALASAYYQYRVVAFNAAVPGETPSNGATAGLAPVPAAPGALAAKIGGTATAPTHVVSWTDASNNEQQFLVERSTDGVNFGLAEAAIARTAAQRTAAAQAFTRTYTGLPVGQTYTYRVTALNGYGSASSSVTLAATAPAAPTGLTSSAGTAAVTSVTLTWTDASTNETSFEVWRSLNGAAATRVATINRTALQGNSAGGLVSSAALTVTATQAYSFYVRAINPLGASTNSAAVFVNVPTSPNALTVTGVRNAAPGTPATYDFTLSWTDRAGNETSYEVERSTTANFAAANVTPVTGLAPNTVSHVLTGVPARTGTTVATRSYWFRVRARNSAGVSVYSNSITLQAQ